MTTLRRRRNKARDTDDQDTYSNFIVKVRDGEIFERPSHEKTSQLVKEGRLPEWLVDLPWLQTQYTSRATMDTVEQSSDSDQGQSPPPSTDQPKDIHEQPKQPDDHPELAKGSSLQSQLINSYKARLQDQAERFTAELDFAKTQLELSQAREATMTEKLDRLLPESTRQNQGREATTQPVDTKTNTAKAKKSTPKTQATKAVEDKSQSWFNKLLYGNKRRN